MIQTYNKFQLKSTKKSKQFKDLTTGQQMLNIIYTQSNLYFFASPSLLLHCFFAQPRSFTTFNFLSLNGVQDYIFTQIFPVLRSYSRNSRFKTQKTSLMCPIALQVSKSPSLQVNYLFFRYSAISLILLSVQIRLICVISVLINPWNPFKSVKSVCLCSDARSASCVSHKTNYHLAL